MYRVATSCLLAFLLSFPVHASEKEQTYCDDPAEWAAWEQRAAKNAGNLDMQALHALWVGLCMKIKSGSVTEDEASSIFDRAHQTLIEQWREEKSRLPQAPTS